MGASQRAQMMAWSVNRQMTPQHEATRVEEGNHQRSSALLGLCSYPKFEIHLGHGGRRQALSTRRDGVCRGPGEKRPDLGVWENGASPSVEFYQVLGFPPSRRSPHPPTPFPRRPTPSPRRQNAPHGALGAHPRFSSSATLDMRTGLKSLGIQSRLCQSKFHPRVLHF